MRFKGNVPACQTLQYLAFSILLMHAEVWRHWARWQVDIIIIVPQPVLNGILWSISAVNLKFTSLNAFESNILTLLSEQHHNIWTKRRGQFNIEEDIYQGKHMPSNQSINQSIMCLLSSPWATSHKIINAKCASVNIHLAAVLSCFLPPISCFTTNVIVSWSD